jgi:hypothetical protein
MKKSLWIAVAAVLAIGFTFAADSPLTKDGLWSGHSVVKLNPDGKPTETTASMCRNRAYDKQKGEEAKGKATCKAPVTSTQGANTRITEVECTMGAVTTKIKETVTVIDDNTVHAITQSSFSPEKAGVREMILTADMKYLGPCPPGMEPGDVMVNGKVTKPPKP